MTAGKKYYYWLKACNAVGNSAFSAGTNATTMASAAPGNTNEGLTIWNNVPASGENVLIYITKPSTQVSDGIVHIKIYSLSGILIREIASAAYSQLAQPVQFDPGFLPAGTYIIHAQGAGVNDYKKIYIKK